MWSVLLVFLSSLDRNLVKGDPASNALEAEKQSKETFCVKVSSVETNFLYEVSHGTDVVRSMVSAAGKLVNCSITIHPEQVASFTHECRLQRKDDRVERQVHAPYERVDEARLLCQRFTEKLQHSEKPMQQDQVLKRAKRGFTYPGTLWCGAGNMADNFNQLGDFAETDSCCRTHDHCPHVIHAFSSNYGHTNFKWHSICHCDCDNTLKDCLRKVNDTSSRVVGQAFFNVIGVPCFEFAYEEQCVERHWYGLCKRYEKRPIAVLKEAVPYDFGGIDVIDELTVAPSKKKDSNTSEEQVKSDTTTQSTMSGSQGSSPEEPSLQNVVTAAEDFIKVLATVSTSQSSTNDSEKGDSQSSDKKKKKTKKKKTKKTKGKGRKRKQKTVVKIEDSAADPLSNTKTDNAIGLSNFLTESQSPEQPDRQSKRVKNQEYALGGKEETSNEVMKDEPAMEEAAVSMTSTSPVPKKAAKKGFLTTTSSYRAKTKWLRNNKRKVKPVSSQSSNESTSEIEATTTAITTTPSKPQPSIVSPTEWQLIVNTTPIEVSKVKKNRSKLKKDREERKKRQKATSAASSTPVVVNENIGGNLKEASTLTTGTPTTPPPVASQTANFSRVRGSAHATALNTSFSVLKRQRQRSKEKGLTKRKRKGPSLVLLNEQLFQNNANDTLPILLPTPTAAMASLVFTAAKSGSTEDIQTTRKWQLFTTSIPAVGAKKRRNKKRQKSRKTATSIAVQNLVTFTSPTTKPVNLYLTRSDSSTHATTTTSANPALSPMQITIEKVKEQFDRKKRRKAALSSVPQQ